VKAGDGSLFENASLLEDGKKVKPLFLQLIKLFVKIPLFLWWLYKIPNPAKTRRWTFILKRTGDGSLFLFTILKPFICKGFRPPSGMP